jgi:hypothetical protein
MTRGHEPNVLFRAARQRLTSPSDALRPMSRQELADAVNSYLRHEHGVHAGLDQDDIGRIERGYTRWPASRRRLGFREVLGASTEDELGFHPLHRGPRV